MRPSRHHALCALIASAMLTMTACATGLVSSGISVTRPEDRATPSSSTDTDSGAKEDSTKTSDSPKTDSTSPSTAQPVPQGWMKVTTTITPVSFAVPDDWLPIGANVSEEEALANAQRATLDLPEQTAALMRQRVGSDIIYVSSNPDHFGDNIQVFKETFPSDEVDPERLLDDQIQKGATITSTRKERSALGEVTIVEVDTTGAPMTLFVVPANERESLLLMSLSLNKERLDTNVRTIISTLTK